MLRPLLTRLCLTTLLLAYSCHGVALADDDTLPERPADFIRDDARTMDAGTKGLLSEEIRQFTARSGLQLYLDTNAFLLGNESALIRARRLVGHWLDPKTPGIVLCLNRGASVVPVLQYNGALQAAYPDGDLVTLSYEVAVNVDACLRPEEKIPTALRTVLHRMTALQSTAKLSKKALEGREWTLALALLLGATGLGLVIHWLLLKLDKDELSALEQLELPEVEVGQRFGAPGGGGLMAELSY
jgi:hypothetical protein